MNLEDERLAKIESEKQNAISNANSVYQNLNNQAENLYNQQQQYAAEYQQTQDEVLDKQLANQTAKIEQQKQVATENRDTEAKRARNDYQAYINPYGVNAESLASRGLLNSGLSETSQLGGYNTYQNRVASANKALQDAITAYDNDINDAQLNNDVAKAQNALTKLEMQLKYAQSYYDTSSQLAQNSLANQQTLNSQYANQYQAMLGQILNENQYKESIRQYNADLAEKQRQYNQNMAYQKARDKVADAQWQKEYELSKKSVAVSRKSSSSSSSRSSKGGSGGNSKKLPINTKNKDYTKIAPDIGSMVKQGAELASGKKSNVNPSTGTVHPDAKKGVLGNGYQPDNVGGKKLSASGKKVKDIFTGENSSAFGKQQVWEAGGKYYVWYGGINDYVDVTKEYNKAVNNKTMAGFSPDNAKHDTTVYRIANPKQAEKESEDKFLKAVLKIPGVGPKLAIGLAKLDKKLFK